MAQRRRRGATPRARPRGPRRGSRPGRAATAAPVVARVVLYSLLGLITLVAADFVYQVIRKPTELFFPVSGALFKTPAETWRAYGALFHRYSTPLIEAEQLAALAQAEASGNPLVRTYWRWSWPAGPFDVYRPASSAVGMFQITDPTFAEASQYCIHDHALVREGAWDAPHTCWFNRLYLRVLPGDAVELTAAYLDLKVSAILAHSGRHAGATQVRHVATVVHLCGAGAAAVYARRGFQFAAGQHCGDHDPRLYLDRVDALHEEFVRLAGHDSR
jgi:hypothetical protein